MNRNNYPSLYQSADQLSIKSQKTFINLIKGYLYLLIFQSIVSSFKSYIESFKILSLISLIIIIIIIITMAIKNYNNTWYNARAVAESIKTLTWKYMMRAEPYSDCCVENSKYLFKNDVKKILDYNKEVSFSFTGEFADKEFITTKMDDVRSLAVNHRLNFYVENRIDNQREWYRKKAQNNLYNGKKWFIIMIVLLFTALTFQSLEIYMNPTFNIPYDFITTAATGILTWVQTKKYRELSAAYSLTSHEIGIIKSLSCFVNDEDKIN